MDMSYRRRKNSQTKGLFSAALKMAVQQKNHTMRSMALALLTLHPALLLPSVSKGSPLLLTKRLGLVLVMGCRIDRYHSPVAAWTH